MSAAYESKSGREMPTAWRIPNTAWQACTHAKIAVRSVGYGDVFGTAMAQTAATPFFNQNGKMYVSLASSKDIADSNSGVLAYIEIEALTDGKPEVSFDSDMVNILTADGKNFSIKF